MIPNAGDKIMSMNKLTIEIIPDHELGGYTARVPDIPAYGEGQTEEAAITDLKDAVRVYIETFGLEDALSRLNSSMTLREINVGLKDFSVV